MKKQNEKPIIAKEFRQPTAVIRITDYYHPGIEHERVALYEVTRAHWNAEHDHSIIKTKLALAVHEGRVLEVYEIAAWLPANSTMMAQRLDSGCLGRMEFVGNIARTNIRNKFIGRIIDGLIAHGDIRPVICFGVK